MLSARHDEIKAGQSKAALSPPTQLAAARVERRAAEIIRAGLLLPSSAPAASAASACIIAFPGPARRCAGLMPDALVGWPDKPLHNVTDVSHRRQPAPFQAKPVETAKCFTVADRIALLEWSSHGSGGYARVMLEEGVPGATPDRSGYVLLYRQYDRFAVLGVTRRAGDIMVWRCSDGTGFGAYPTMAAALAGLPPAAKAS
jgi:hypothetical protein